MPGLLDLLPARYGHFRFESGHHGDAWLDLDQWLSGPARLNPFFDELATRLRAHTIEVVCGPVSGGAFVAHAVALAGSFEFCYAERQVGASEGARLSYVIPEAFRSNLRGKRVGVLDDVINAGSAVRSTVSDLRACGSVPVVVGSLVALMPAAGLAIEVLQLPFEFLATLPNRLWLPADCPLCSAGMPIQTPADLKPQKISPV